MDRIPLSSNLFGEEMPRLLHSCCLRVHVPKMMSACGKRHGVERKPETLNTFDLLVVFSYFSECPATCWSASGISYSLAFLSLLRAWKPTTALPEVGCYYFLFPAQWNLLYKPISPYTCQPVFLATCPISPQDMWELLDTCLFIYLLKVNYSLMGKTGTWVSQSLLLLALPSSIYPLSQDRQKEHLLWSTDYEILTVCWTS